MNWTIREVTDSWEMSDFHHIPAKKAQPFGTIADFRLIHSCATTPKGVVSPLKKITLTQ
jgi:hypothetical protein